VALAESLSAALTVRVLALAEVALLRVFARRARLTCEGALVDFELDSLDESNVGRNTVADVEGDQIARDEGVG
jgi:hypothetical protein